MFWDLTLKSSPSRNIKIRPASVKTFDEVTMENGTTESNEVEDSNPLHLQPPPISWKQTSDISVTGVCFSRILFWY